ncbi:ABC transporter ATP-binding protein [Oligoflexia bacterium]|nr:ABC transporter ATP-binding protein [Oligoflexia bacterium]
MKAPQIAIEHLSYSFGEQRVLDNVSFRICSGERVSILGPNGAGKTTLLKCIGNIYTALPGTILLNGKSVARLTQKEIARVVGYVPQQLEMPFPYTVFEFLSMARYPHLAALRALSAKDEEVIERALHTTASADLKSRCFSELSGGERQRVLIAAALAQEPEILLLDEPTVFLDPKYQAQINRLLSEIRERSHVTILTVTHDINMACSEGDRIIALKAGELFFDGKPKDLLVGDNLERLYGTKFSVLEHKEREHPVVVWG